MKALYLLIIILISCLVLIQCKVKHAEAHENITLKTLIGFEKIVPVNDSSDIGINWEVEKPVSEFILKGKNPLVHKFELINDSVAVLSQKINNNWIETDKIQFSPWMWRVSDTEVISQFQITDFNQDGNEDLICLVESNVNTNEWVYIYLNNGKKLIQLYNTADEGYIWDNPQYDPKRKTINTELFSSAYGIANTAIYKLEGQLATPIGKSEGDSATHANTIIHNNYIGENGKWKLIKTEIEKIGEE